MKKSVVIFISLFILFSGCRNAFEFSMLTPKGEISSKLPPLEPVVYLSTLENAYSKGQTYSTGSAVGVNIGFGVTVATGSAISTTYADKRVNDALVIFERDVKENISNYVGDKKGTITMKITNSNYYPKTKVGTFVLAWLGTTALAYLPIYSSMEQSNSVGTNVAISFIVPTVTGLIVPAFIKPEATQDLEVEVEILDLQNNVIGRYTGIGKGYYKNNMYKFPKDIQRVVNVEALTKALQQIKTKIEKDELRLKTLLG